MDENSLRLKLRQLVLDNEATLVDGFIHQGVQRTIHQVAVSNLTPPTGYYFIRILVENSTESKLAIINKVKGKKQANHSVVIGIADYAKYQSAENMPFELMDGDFQKFTDRLVSLFDSITYLDCYRLVTESREFDKYNLTDTFEIAEGYAALMYSEIRFTMVEECLNC